MKEKRESIWRATWEATCQPHPFFCSAPLQKVTYFAILWPRAPGCIKSFLVHIVASCITLDTPLHFLESWKSTTLPFDCHQMLSTLNHTATNSMFPSPLFFLSPCMSGYFFPLQFPPFYLSSSLSSSEWHDKFQFKIALATALCQKWGQLPQHWLPWY